MVVIHSVVVLLVVCNVVIYSVVVLLVVCNVVVYSLVVLLVVREMSAAITVVAAWGLRFISELFFQKVILI
jgi:hypothetical protein